MNKKVKIGFIGQGFIGKNYADDFKKRGYNVIRYSLEEEYVGNKNKVAEANYTFIAVPTPSTPDGFDYSIVEEALELVGDGKVAVIKSTILPGTTRKLQDKYPNKIIMHSPEFLSEVTAKHDAEFPERNIVGYVNTRDKEKAKEVLKLLPYAPYNKILNIEEAELIKYACNCFFFTKVVYMNMVYDLAENLGVDWSNIKEAMQNTDMIANWHLDPVHKKGRGAGGHCLPKDMYAFSRMYIEKFGTSDVDGMILLKALENKNKELLKSSGKSSRELKEIFG